MNAKEKARQLIDRYWGKGITNNKEIAKQCALICVNEVMKMPNIGYNHNKDESQYDYWMEVKKELEAL